MPAVLMDTDDEQDVALIDGDDASARVLAETPEYRVLRTDWMSRDDAVATLLHLRQQLHDTRRTLARVQAENRAMLEREEWLTRFRIWSQPYYMADGTRRVRLSYYHTADRVTSCEGKDMEEAVRVARDAIRASALRAVRRSGSDSDGGMAA